MIIPAEFDSIRPFTPEELPEVYERLLKDPLFVKALEFVYPNLSFDKIADAIRQCKSNLDFQKKICYPALQELVARGSLGCSMDASSINIKNRYTFVSNHRDIVLDSAFLSKLLLDVGFGTTCEIAIGDNLLSVSMVKDVVRICKAFMVERALSSVELYRASKRMSEYMHFVIDQKHDNVWIAQREGRAKDSNDLTQPAILKMMVMGGEGSMIERLISLHIVPLSISYEFDPCDYLKARELQLKRDVPFWKKTAEDDNENMLVGIKGYKGHIYYYCAPCIDDWLRKLNPKMHKNLLFDTIAAYIDKQIHSNYKIFASNYVALDILQGNKEHSEMYTEKERAFFEEYLSRQIGKINIENKDEAFLRNCMLNMYANPAKNYLANQTEESGRIKSLLNHFSFLKF